jgi:hypothetical protein
MTELINISVHIDQAAQHQLAPAAIVRLQQQASNTEFQLQLTGFAAEHKLEKMDAITTH